MSNQRPRMSSRAIFWSSMITTLVIGFCIGIIYEGKIGLSARPHKDQTPNSMVSILPVSGKVNVAFPPVVINKIVNWDSCNDPKLVYKVLETMHWDGPNKGAIAEIEAPNGETYIMTNWHDGRPKRGEFFRPKFNGTVWEYIIVDPTRVSYDLRDYYTVP